jgi:hypothetical protein
MIRSMTVRQYVEAYWQNENKLRALLGAEHPLSQTWTFGGAVSAATVNAAIEVENGRIVRIQTWHGVGWFNVRGYGHPVVDISCG